MKYLFSILIVLFSFGGFAQDSKFPDKYIDSIGSMGIVDDSFISKILMNDIILKKLRITYNTTKLNIELVNNKFVPEQKDSSLSFYDNKDSVYFYMAQGKEIPLKIVINTAKVIFDNDIKVGVNKQFFMHKFNIKKLPDDYFIRDLEGSCNVAFVFKNNVLVRMVFVSYPD